MKVEVLQLRIGVLRALDVGEIYDAFISRDLLLKKPDLSIQFLILFSIDILDI